MNDLYHIDKFQINDNVILAQLSLNPGHEIFSGHFPGQPILPGVCMIQIAKELLQKRLEANLSLEKADQIKFLTVIDPLRTRQFEAKLDYKWSDEEQLIASGSFFNGETVYFKLQGAIFVNISLRRGGAGAGY
jgi:3-hydroxyacyl-[acyl-carrier-protein] dehydratase